MQTEGMTLPCGCPGSQSRTIAHEESAVACNTEAVSRLSQWPVQIKLVPARAPYFDGAKLLIAVCGDGHNLPWNKFPTLL